MKLDKDLMDRIIFEAETLEPGKRLIGLPGVDRKTFGAHVKVLMEKGLLRGSFEETLNDGPAVKVELTASGQEYAEQLQTASSPWAHVARWLKKPFSSLQLIALEVIVGLLILWIAGVIGIN